MILQSLYEYVEKSGRVEESVLLAHFHLRQEGLHALIAPLLKRGKVQKTLHQRGSKLAPVIYYSCPTTTQIPSMTII